MIGVSDAHSRYGNLPSKYLSLFVTDAMYDGLQLLRWRRLGCIKHTLHACAELRYLCSGKIN